LRTETKPGKRFCAEESVLRGDDFLGTTTVTRCYLMIEYYGNWGSKVADIVDKSRLSDSLKAQVRQFQEEAPEDVRVLLCKRADRNRSRSIYLARYTDEGLYLNHIPRDRKDLDLMGAYRNPVAARRDIVLVCTHGKRDKCCAKWGFPVYKSLVDSLHEGFEVFECTHVGGDRFAANVIWLPYGHCFGHTQLDPEHFAQQLNRGRIALNHYRGCSALPSPAQYLDGVVRTATGNDSPRPPLLRDYRESALDDNATAADITLYYADRELEKSARVIVRPDEETGRILASCNVDGTAYRRQFSLCQD